MKERLRQIHSFVWSNRGIWVALAVCITASVSLGFELGKRTAPPSTAAPACEPDTELLALWTHAEAQAARAASSLAECSSQLEECQAEPRLGDYTPLGGMCAEADRACLAHGFESLTCTDARFRCCLACQGVQRRRDLR